MNFELADQTVFFLKSILLGVGFGILYDAFFVLRRLLPAKIKPHVFLDILYFLLIAIMLFDYALIENHGRMRYFILLGAGLGWIIYHLSVSRFVLKIVEWLLQVLNRLITILLRPLRSVAVKTHRRMEKSKKNLKRPKIRLKNGLKKRTLLLYNKTTNNTEGSAHPP